VQRSRITSAARVTLTGWLASPAVTAHSAQLRIAHATLKGVIACSVIYRDVFNKRNV